MINLRRISMLLSLILILLPLSISAGTLELSRTGQTGCWDENGNALADCSGTGMDGDTLAGVAWPAPRFTNNGDGTLTDNLTGLMWLNDANCFGLLSWEDALKAVADFNTNPGLVNCSSYDEGDPPYTDWRPPNIVELETLVNAGFDTELCGAVACTSNADWLNSQGFSSPQANYYWSSTTDTLFPDEARAVDMDNGDVYRRGKTFDTQPIIPVRAGQNGVADGSFPANVWKTGQKTCFDGNGANINCANTGQDGDIRAGVTWPGPRFTDNGDGTVTDNLTGRIWLKDANCMATQYPGFDNDGIAADGQVTWEHALLFITGVNSGLYSNCRDSNTDWQLPNRKDLLSLHDYSKDSPVLPAGHPFDNLILEYYWSSTTKSGAYNIAWRDSIENGFLLTDFKSSDNYVWPVRSEATPTPTPTATPTITPTPTSTPEPPQTGMTIYLPLITRN